MAQLLTFRQFAAKLRKAFPVDRPVRIVTKPYKTVNIEGHRAYGYSYLTKRNTFAIVIERHEDLSISKETLIHEWSHLLVWGREKLLHSRLFWDTYSKVYRVMIG